jgi:hypothetical protein
MRLTKCNQKKTITCLILQDAITNSQGGKVANSKGTRIVNTKATTTNLGIRVASAKIDDHPNIKAINFVKLSYQ